MADPAHEVWVPCDCGNIEACRMELYVSDVRIAYEVVRRIMSDITKNAVLQRIERDDGHRLARA